MSQFIGQPVQLLHAVNIESHRDGSLSLFVRSGIHGGDIDLALREDLGNIYEGDDLMTEYSTFIQYMGDYYQVVGGWAEARTAWWNMLQQIGSGADVTEAVEEFVTTANAAAAK